MLTKDEDWFRMEGDSSLEKRRELITSFNDPHNSLSKLFFSSTKLVDLLWLALIGLQFFISPHIRTYKDS